MAVPLTTEQQRQPPNRVAARGAVLLLLVGLAVLAWQTVAFGLGMATRKGSPDFAVRLAPRNALVLASVAQQRLADRPAEAEALARRALERDPANALAASTLGLSVLRDGQSARSARLLTYSMALSRRDLQAQLWAIEVAVNRGDIPSALHHYDTALRVGKSLPSVLFPVLTAASSDPSIAGPLAHMLTSGVPWGSSFLDYLSMRAESPVAAARLLSRIYAAGGTVPREPVTVLVQRLVDVEEPVVAWQLYSRADPGSARTLIRNGDFRRAIELPTPFDWQVQNGADASGEIAPDAARGALHVEARVGAGGIVARQRLLLRPGRYHLQYEARPAEEATLGDSVVEVSCLSSGTVLATARLTAPPAVQRRGVAVSVPERCPDQAIVVRLDSGGEEKSLEGWVSRLALVREAGATLQ